MPEPPASIPPPDGDRRTTPRSDPVRRAHHDGIYDLARAAERHDEDTGRHVLAVRSLAEMIALGLGLDPADAEALGYDAMLHDVGKLEIPRDLLTKPGGLTPAERALMESHTVHGEAMLKDRPMMARAASVARSHHECWDGSGYPDGLVGEAIPVAARITAAADVIDALLARRAYKQAWTIEQALDLVRGLAGTKLDPAVVAVVDAGRADGRLTRAIDIAEDVRRRTA